MEVYCELLHRIFTTKDESTQIDIVRQLVPFEFEMCVLEALCRIATETDSHRVREAVIKRLKIQPTKANRCFINHAHSEDNPIRQRGALICLGLMGCKTAKDVVLKGLRARSFAVRLAASLNTGLYYDKDALEAFERFFEQNRFGLCLKFIMSLPEKSKSKHRGSVKAIDRSRFDSELSAETA